MNVITRLVRYTFALACAMAVPQVNATDFPAGTVTANVSSALSCSNIVGTGPVSGVTATRNGANLDISVPANGPFLLPATIQVLGIPLGTPSSTSIFMTGAESLSGLGSAVLVVEGGVAKSFSVSVTFTGGCTVTMLIIGAAGEGQTSIQAPSQALQEQIALTRTVFGVFVDAVNAAGFALDFIRGIDVGRPLTLGPNGGSFQVRGLSAGDHRLPLGVWGTVGYTDSENDSAALSSESTRWHGTIGLDAAVTDWLIVGLAGGYESDDTDTAFNAGNIETDGFTIVTYLGAVLSDHFSADLALGRSFLDSDQFRTAGGTRISSDLESERFFVAGNINYGRNYGDWRITTRAGALWVRDEQDAFVESNGAAVASDVFKVGRAKLGAELARMYGSVEPFVSATYNYSFTQSQPVAGGTRLDRSDVLVGLGARYFGAGGMSGSFEFNTLLGRENVDEYSVNVLLRADF